MKKRYIALIAIVVLIIVVAGIFIYERLHASLYVNEEGTSYSIIGGADGPTAIFVAGKLPDSSQNEAEQNKEEDSGVCIDSGNTWNDNYFFRCSVKQFKSRGCG